MGGYAWVTLATNDAYSLGALVLAHSLRRVGTKYELAVLVTPGVTNMMREKLAAVFSLVQEVNVLDSKDEANLALLARPELGITFTKLHCWRLTQYEKCVFVDADTLVVKNCDELFEREELSAAPDVGWPDCFNSGVFVFKPSQQTFASITAFAAAKGSFDGGDQGLLNMYFNDWARKDISKHLPFIYNMCSTAMYSYLPAFKQFGEDVRIIHFIGITKPWLQYFDTLTGIVQPPAGSPHLQPLLQLWWNIFCEKVHPQLSPSMATSTLAPIWHDIIPIPYASSVPRTPVYNDTNHDTYSDVYTEAPDFSEFKDPWENYSWKNDQEVERESSNEHVAHYSRDNDQVYDVTNDQHTYEESNDNHSYHNPSNEEPNQFSKKDENVSIVENRRQEEHTYLYVEDNHYRNVSTEEQHQHHWSSEQKVIHHDQHQHANEYQHTQHHHHHHHHHQQQQQQQQQQQHHHHHNHHHHHHHETKQNDHHSNNNQYHCHHEHHTVQYEESKHRHEEQSHCHEEQDRSHNNYEQEHHSHEQQSHNHKENYCHNNVEQVMDTTEPSREIIHNNILHEHKTHEKINAEQSNYSSYVDDKRTDEQKLTSHPSSKPCTDLHNVATQSDLNITGRLDSSNAGLAGALAQMTLGEPRSAEQIALEEHMRKQSWEQGQIDYMGRDSFDNIWKKICETLSHAPTRQPSPPKTTSEDETKSKETEVEVTKEASTDLKTLSKGSDEVDSSAAKPTTDLRETQPLICTLPKDNVSLQETSVKHDSSLSSTQIIDTPQLDAKHESANINVQSSSVDEKTGKLDAIDLKGVSVDTDSKKELPELKSQAICEANVGLAETDITKDICMKMSMDLLSGQTKILEQTIPTDTVQRKEEDVKVSVDVAQELSTQREINLSSEVMLTNPVPIQVAESVLQTEPKESVTQEVKLITEEVISSTVAPVQESVVASSETLVELTDTTQLCDPTLLVSSNEPANVIDLTTTSNVSQNGDTVTNGSTTIKLCESSLLEQPALKHAVEEIQSSPGEVSQPQKTEALSEQAVLTESPKTAVEQRTGTVETKDTGSSDTPSDVTSELKTENLEEEQQVTESTALLDTSKSSLESESAECPIRPTRTRELTIPSTPTVTEPTPPTSPIAVSTPDVESQGKTVKKTTKKVVKKTPSDSDSADRADTEGAEKKTAKKVVKKVVKKPKEGQDEGGESSSATEKPKKTVKGTKKITKPSQSLETDTSVPETPPPGSSDAPVPPKRKVKASTSTKPTSTAQKPDTES